MAVAGALDHTAYRDVDFGHVQVEVRPDELVGRYVLRDGKVKDTWVIPNSTPGTQPAPQPVAAAAQAAVGAGAVAPAPAAA